MLTQTSRVLAVSLDYGETVSRVASLMLSGLADWCVVETVDAEGSSTEVAVAHHDAQKRALAQEMRRLYPPRADRFDIPRRVLATGRAELVADVSDALLKSIAQDADHLHMLRELAPRSLLVVPLQTRERVLGTILLANCESGRRFTTEDLERAQDLARRAALAIDNASLHRSEQAVEQRDAGTEPPAARRAGGRLEDALARAVRRFRGRGFRAANPSRTTP
jgi:GAF domain-containing protein